MGTAFRFTSGSIVIQIQESCWLALVAYDGVDEWLVKKTGGSSFFKFYHNRNRKHSSFDSWADNSFEASEYSEYKIRLVFD